MRAAERGLSHRGSALFNRRRRPRSSSTPRTGLRRPHRAVRRPGGEPLEHLLLVEVLPAEPVDVGPVRLERRDAGVERVGGVDPVPRPAASRPPTPPVPRPTAPGRRSSCSGKIHRLPASRTRVEDGPADGDVVGLVERSCPERLAEVAGDDDLGLVTAYHLGDGGAAAATRTPPRRRGSRGTPRRRRPTIRADSICSCSRTAGTRRAPARRCRPRRRSPYVDDAACPDRSTAPPRPRRRTPCRRGGPRSRPPSTSPRAAA